MITLAIYIELQLGKVWLDKIFAFRIIFISLLSAMQVASKLLVRSSSNTALSFGRQMNVTQTRCEPSIFIHWLLLLSWNTVSSAYNSQHFFKLYQWKMNWIHFSLICCWSSLDGTAKIKTKECQYNNRNMLKRTTAAYFEIIIPLEAVRLELESHPRRGVNGMKKPRKRKLLPPLPLSS